MSPMIPVRTASSPSRFIALAALAATSSLSATFIMEIDVDGADDGPITYNPGFSFGGDTTTASTSAASSAYGMSGADSIFGGDGVNEADTYIYHYNPSLDPDNLAVPAGTDLGGGNLATGIVGGGAGLYAVYATWPFTDNVSGGDTGFSVVSDDDSFFLSLDQNGLGDEWIKLGEIFWSSGTITVTQSSQINAFVSMRAAGVLFEAISDVAIPEPSSVAFAGIPVLFALLASRRRRS